MRKGTPQQVRDHDIARRELDRNAWRERKRGIREETEEYHRLNHQLWETEKPLSLWQRAMSGARLDREERYDRRTKRRERRMKRRDRRRHRRTENRNFRGEIRSDKRDQRAERRSSRLARRPDRRESPKPAPRARAGRTAR